MRKVIVQCKTCDSSSAFLKLTSRATGYWVCHSASLLCLRPEEGAQVPEHIELICSRSCPLLKRPTSGYSSPVLPQPQITYLLFCRFALRDNYQIVCIAGARSAGTFFESRADIRWGWTSVTLRQWDLKKSGCSFVQRGPLQGAVFVPYFLPC